MKNLFTSIAGLFVAIGLIGGLAIGAVATLVFSHFALAGGLAAAALVVYLLIR